MYKFAYNIRAFFSIIGMLLSFNYYFPFKYENTITIFLIFIIWLFANYVTHRFQRDVNNGFIEFLNPNLKGLAIFSLGLLILSYKVPETDLFLNYAVLNISFELVAMFLSPLLIHKESKSEFKKGIIQIELNREISLEKKSVFDEGQYEGMRSREAIKVVKKSFENKDTFTDCALNKNMKAFIINENLINDTVNIDASLLSDYNLIESGGYLIIFYKKLENRYTKFRYFDYFFHGVLPTLPLMKNFYLFLCRGRNRILSTSEMWGRLHRIGFDVQSEITLLDSNMIFSEKKYMPMTDVNPSYSPLIKLDRVSLGGSLVSIHKIRSMYPYSEFNQKKVFELNSLDSSGKFNDDFRITPFGNFIRKFWIDELPQIIDWFRGNIKIVGIRAMSQQYFSLYPNRYQKKYKKVKPGFVSPIFDPNEGSFELIVKTEEKYLDNYLNNPIRTDIKYFFKTFLDVFYRGVKSR